MNGIFASPTTKDQPLGNSGYMSPDEDGDEENSIRVKLFFYCESKTLRERVFPEEWYTVVAEEYGSDEANPSFQPWLEFYVRDFATFGEMLLMGLTEANTRFEMMQSETRFVRNVNLGEEVFDVYMAKKKTGKPKDGEPNWELTQKVKEAGVTDNLFTVVYSEQAIESENAMGSSSKPYHEQPESEPHGHQLPEVNGDPSQALIEQAREPSVHEFAAPEYKRDDSLAPAKLIENAMASQNGLTASQNGIDQKGKNKNLQDPVNETCCKKNCVIF